MQAMSLDFANIAAKKEEDRVWARGLQGRGLILLLSSECRFPKSACASHTGAPTNGPTMPLDRGLIRGSRGIPLWADSSSGEDYLTSPASSYSYPPNPCPPYYPPSPPPSCKTQVLESFGRWTSQTGRPTNKMLYNVVCPPVNVPHTLLDVLCVCFTASYLPSLLLLSVIGHPRPPGTPVVGLHALKADKPVLISLFAGNEQSSLNTEIMNKFPLWI